MVKYQDCLFDQSGILRASVEKENRDLGNTGSQRGQLAFFVVFFFFFQEARSLTVQRWTDLLLSGQISGERRRASEQKKAVYPDWSDPM